MLASLKTFVRNRPIIVLGAVLLVIFLVSPLDDIVILTFLAAGPLAAIAVLAIGIVLLLGSRRTRLGQKWWNAAYGKVEGLLQ